MCEILPKMRKICYLLVTTLKILQFLVDFVPQTPYRGSAPGPRRGLPSPRPLWFCPHPKPPYAANASRTPYTHAVNDVLS